LRYHPRLPPPLLPHPHETRRQDPRRPPARTAPAVRHHRQRRAGPARLHRRPAHHRARHHAPDPDRHGHPPGRPRLCCADPAALGHGPQARHRARQPGRPDRFGLPGPAHGQHVEPWQHGVRAEPDGAPRTAGHRARRAGRAEHRR